MKVGSAFTMVMGIFEPMERKNEIMKKKYRKAEAKVIFELLEGMADKHGKVPKYKGGRFEKIEEEGTNSNNSLTKVRWVDRGGEPKDVLTLIMNMMIYRFTHNGALCCQYVMSTNGKFIYLVSKADNKSLMKAAE